jgi:hypothetical protein
LLIFDCRFVKRAELVVCALTDGSEQDPWLCLKNGRAQDDASRDTERKFI